MIGKAVPQYAIIIFSDQTTVCTNHLLVVMLYLGENLSRCTCMIGWHCQRQNASWSLLYQIIIKENHSILSYIYQWKINKNSWSACNKYKSQKYKITKIKTLQNINKSSLLFVYKLEQQLSSKMEKIISNPGFQHLAEEVFWNLEVEDLKICALVNQSCKQILGSI